MTESAALEETFLSDEDVEYLNANFEGWEPLKDTKEGSPKVKILKKAIKKMGMNVDVEIHQLDTYDGRVIEFLCDCDVIFGCVDSAGGRYHLECISKAYFIPYFDIGVYLEADQQGGISHANAVSGYSHPESLKIINPSLPKCNDQRT